MTRATDSITNDADVIDSRDIIARIEALTDERDNCLTDLGDDASREQRAAVWATDYPDDAAELAALESLAEEAEGYAADWKYGETLIRDSYFQAYAQELAEDIGAVPSDAAWPAYCIDWEQAARDLRMDYTAVDFDGVTYWVR